MKSLQELTGDPNVTKHDVERRERTIPESWKKDLPAVGPWIEEPDKIVWVDPATDLDCTIVRNDYGALCGYVGVGQLHPWYGRAYNECVKHCMTKMWDREFFSCSQDHGGEPGYAVEVHGGLTYTGFTNEIIGSPCRHELLWWFGFDCAHAFDLSPLMPMMEMEVYRDMPYVIREVQHLAKQLQEVKRDAEVPVSGNG